MRAVRSSRSVTGASSALAVLVLLSLLASAPIALGAGPATVTVRAVGPGPSYQTLVPLTTVTTNATPVVNDGNSADSCSGTSAAGALQLATAGNWKGTWSAELSAYFVETIAGTALSGSYWNFWHNNAESTLGICGVEPSAGDSLLFFPECYEKCSGPPPSVLSIQAPATAEVGKPVSIQVLSYPNPAGAPVPQPEATVTGGGESSQPTDAQGQTTMTFTGDERFSLYARGPAEAAAIPAEAFICAHEGNDGTCGTTAPAGSTAATQTSSAPLGAAPYRGPFALVARATALSEGRVYRRGHAPRTLTGEVVAHTAVDSVSIGLRRSYRGRCSTYNAARERFLRARCGTDSFFKVASGATSFSYLLPAQLSPGRYVFDIQAVDAAGNHVALARGSSRIVFHVQ
ncbi:MAG: hypothetical protein ACHQDY_05330 [Solirubrobacterales bacterium]